MYIYIYILGLYRNSGKENENYYNACYYRFGRLKKKMETTVMGYIGLGRMEKKMETTVMGYTGLGRIERKWKLRCRV